jgi:hypothetical protein
MTSRKDLMNGREVRGMRAEVWEKYCSQRYMEVPWDRGAKQPRGIILDAERLWPGAE